jgi:chemotaxis protein MotB
MKTTMVKSLFYIATCCAFLFSCVPARQLDEMKKKEAACRAEADEVRAENQKLSTKVTELQATFDNLTKRLAGLELDSNVRGTSLRTMTTNYDQLNKTYLELLKNYKDILAGNTSETQKILVQLKTTQDSLLNKEDALKKLAADLDTKKATLDKLGKQLEASKADLDAKDAKLNELQSVLNKKDSTVKALKAKVMDALTGYEGKGLTITQKNGKIYVSLDESLLFASGSFTVDPKGVEAIKKLAKVLETNTDINVLIEGHTDNVPYTGTGVIKDNWDLSVLRATAIVKIITNNSNVDPKRLTAAGRSEYDPVESNETKEGKAKNRRTEIILTPKLDELFQIIETN